MKKLFIVASILFLFTTPVKADGAPESSITGDFANKTMSVELTDGRGIFDHNSDLREEYNNKIIQGIENKNLSLYDRFGGNIRFVPYYGEKKFGIGIADKIYSEVKENNEEFDLSLTDILKSSDAQVNNTVYEGRPDIISEENFEAGFIDPRRSEYMGPVSSSGGEASVGNMYLYISILINSVVSYFLSSKIYEDVMSIWDMATTSGLYESLGNIINSFVPLLAIVFVGYLLMSVIKMLKGRMSIGSVLMTSVSFVLSIGIIFTALANPHVFRPITSVIVDETNKLFSYTLNVDANEVTKSDDPKYIIEATLWSKSVLDPWAMGMFDGKTYDELYTQFADNSKIKMDQSNEDILEERNDGERRYGSAYLTGDVKVPLGNNNEVRNWAALAWSTQSLYHIEAVDSETEIVNNDITEEGKSIRPWPKASLTPLNNQIYADSFRWLDAKLDISPGFDGPDDNDGNYAKAKPYTQSFVKYGMYSLFLSLLMLPLMYPAITKLVSLIKVITSSIRWMYLSIMSIVKPGDGRYSHITNLKTIFLPMYYFYWWSMVAYIMIYMYNLLIGTVVGDIVWLIIAYMIIKFKPITSTKHIRDMKYKAISQFNNITRKFSKN